jgi:hypothetical protein
VFLVVSYWVIPPMNGIRSGSAFIEQIERKMKPGEEVGIFGFREQYLLTIQRPITHFGHDRWTEGYQEASDAALWLASGSGRALVVNEWAFEHCFANYDHDFLAVANRRQWFLIRGEGDAACTARGNPQAVYRYVPPAVVR